MAFLYSSEGTIHWQQSGAAEGPALVLSHALGLDLTLWDRIVPLLPQSLRIVRYDLRGHGASACPPPPYRMGTLVSDAERLLDPKHQIDMGYRIPALNIKCRHVITQCELIVVEYLTKHVFEASVQIHVVPQLVPMG